MTKAARQKAILELLHRGPVESQEEMQRFLAKRGFEAGQATLSRDIRELLALRHRRRGLRLHQSSIRRHHHVHIHFGL